MLLHPLDRLLAGNGFLGALAGAGIGSCSLPADWKAASVAQPPVAVDVSQTRDSGS